MNKQEAIEKIKKEKSPFSSWEGVGIWNNPAFEIKKAEE